MIDESWYKLSYFYFLFLDPIAHAQLTAHLVNQKIKSQCPRQIPLQEVLMRFTDDIFDFK